MIIEYSIQITMADYDYSYYFHWKYETALQRAPSALALIHTQFTRKLLLLWCSRGQLLLLFRFRIDICKHIDLKWNAFRFRCNKATISILQTQSLSISPWFLPFPPPTFVSNIFPTKAGELWIKIKNIPRMWPVNGEHVHHPLDDGTESTIFEVSAYE